jgi:hypothetical protein
MTADERDPRAVRRPCCGFLVEGAAGQGFGLLRRDIEEIQVGALTAQVA